MPLLSTLRAPAVSGVRLALASLSKVTCKPENLMQVRKMSDHRTMPIIPSRFQWERAKDNFVEHQYAFHQVKDFLKGTHGNLDFLKTHGHGFLHDTAYSNVETWLHHKWSVYNRICSNSAVLQHYFITLGLVPVYIIITYINVRIGPAELREAPEGYVPRDYEYLRSPIQRIFMKYFIYDSYEKQYERSLYFLDKASKRQLATRKLQLAHELAREKQDTKGWYFVPRPLDEVQEAIRQRRELEDISPKV